jgi:ComF family protein
MHVGTRQGGSIPARLLSPSPMKRAVYLTLLRIWCTVRESWVRTPPCSRARAQSVRLAHAARRVRKALRYLSAVLLPSACALCGTSSRELLRRPCAFCLDDPRLRCTRCALPWIEPSAGERVGPDSLCGRCIARAPAYDATVCVADYAEPADALVIALKFLGRLELACLLGTTQAQRTLQSGALLPDLVIPVPLSAARLCTRGYNQAHEIARTFARALDRPYCAGCIARVRDTPAQSGLRGAARWRTMRRAFRVIRTQRVRGAHIGLVDDVMTSGATLDAAALALKRAGAARVTVFVVLRTPIP